MLPEKNLHNSCLTESHLTKTSYLVGVDAPLFHVLQLFHSDAAGRLLRCHGWAAAAVVHVGAWKGEQTVWTSVDKQKKTETKANHRPRRKSLQLPSNQIHWTFLKLQEGAEIKSEWVNEQWISEWMSERKNLQETPHPLFVVLLSTVSSLDNHWKYDSLPQHQCVKWMDGWMLSPLRLPQYLWVHSTGSLSGRGKKCWGERYFSWPSYADLR